MAAYFDSSALLTVLLSEPKAEEAAAFWDRHPDRVSSLVLEAECLVCLRRYARHLGKKLPKGWLDSALSALDESLKGMSLQQVEEGVMGILRRQSSLSECRTLDAIHLATALFFRDRADGEFFLVTYDGKMRRAADELGLAILPS